MIGHIVPYTGINRTDNLSSHNYIMLFIPPSRQGRLELVGELGDGPEWQTLGYKVREMEIVGDL